MKLNRKEFDALMEKYEPALPQIFNRKKQQAKYQSQGNSYSRVMATDWRLIDCLRNGLSIEKDVYDAALWSVLTPLSEMSVAGQGSSMKVPDFTSGAWKTNKRGMDISLQYGGTTNLL